MKKAVFIKNPSDEKTRFNHPWKNMIFNSRELELPRGDGIVTFKKDFCLNNKHGKLYKAKLRAAALGLFDLFLNGMRVGAYENGEMIYDELKPGWTDYRFRTFEFEYDVTHMISDKNTFTATVSNGWWSGRISFGFYGFRSCAFCGEIELTYEDGTEEIIGSDTAWDTTVCGPVLTADIWNGEYYDARIKSPAVAPSEHQWERAVEYDDFIKGKIELMPLTDRIRVKKELERKPISAVVHDGTKDNGSDYGEINVISKKVGNGCECVLLKKGQRIILDMGQNIVGRPVITVKAKEGTRVCGFFAELLNDSGMKDRGNDGAMGSIYIKNYRSALARLVYISSSASEETYRPTNTFYGFRYFELTADNDIEILNVRGEVLGSEFKETATFTCDNAEVNKLWSNIVYGMRGNYLSAPTDCPQRDERLGWAGDTQIFCGAATYIGDVDKFLRKWLLDAADSQQDFDGAYCDVIPRVFTSNNANAAWGDAGLIVAYRLWLMYNDTDIIAKHYDSMEYYMKHLEKYGLEGANTAYGDWLNYEITDKRYIAVCYYKYDADLMVKFSEILGKTDRAEYYRELSSRVKSHFADKYTDNGRLTMTTQTCYLLALAFDMLSDGRAEAVKALENKITDNDYTLSTGFVGTGILNQTLSSVGLDKLAYSLLLQTKDPSWLYSVRQGATTVWERWNSYTKAKGFGDVGMNSFNHYAYGAVAEWLMAYAAGIRPDENKPGFEHFILSPCKDERCESELPEGQSRINKVSASYDSRKGVIRSAWEYVNGIFTYEFTIPEGTTATVEFPMSGQNENVEINGVEFKAGELGSVKNGRLCFEAAAGSYKICEL